MFAYCSNNPVMGYDPTGEAFFTATIFGIAIWKIFAVTAGLVGTVILTDTIVNNPPVIPPITIPKIEIKPKTDVKSKTEDLAPDLPKMPEKPPVHHIVAKADRRAEEARQILRDVGIEPLIDPRNLVILPKSYHASIHTSAYYKYVNEKLRTVAGDKAAVEKALADLKAEIIMRSVLGTRWN